MAANIKSTTTSSGLDQSLSIQTTASEDVDRAGIDTDVKWVNDKWETYNGYYKKHISTKSVMNKVGMWSVGKGFKADTRTTKILEKIAQNPNIYGAYARFWEGSGVKGLFANIGNSVTNTKKRRQVNLSLYDR